MPRAGNAVALDQMPFDLKHEETEVIE
jgi:hypothetical protein